jgi:Fe-S-cluster-containing dehydrogenase component
MARKCLVINLDRCIGCYSCEVACKMENDVALGHHWNKLYQVEPYGEWPNVKTWWLSKQCQQCENAPCVEVCPTGASYRDEDGVVLIDQEACIGCQLCMTACPYDVRDYNDELGVVQKCTLCKHLTQNSDEKPACVKNCPGKARFFGDLDDPDSDVSRALAAADPDSIHYLPDEGNGPRTAYILSPRIGEWRYEDLEVTVEKSQKYVTTEGSWE